MSALLGVLYALVEHDLKRLLAFHSIENIGIILMGLGASLLFISFHQPALAALALVAGLYHTLNHACFKGLLFLGAGAVLHATGTKNMEELGGLIRRLPWTAFFFLLGAVAISGLPPLNGFVSEWLTYQALLQGFGATQIAVRLIFPIGGALLALTGALAAACFVKAVGITFLALPRSPHAEKAHEAPRSMLFGMATLGLACVVLRRVSDVVPPSLGSGHTGVTGAKDQPATDRWEWLDADISGGRAGSDVDTRDGCTVSGSAAFASGFVAGFLAAWQASRG